MVQLAAGLVQNFTERHLDQLQMGDDTIEYFRRQGGEQMVFV